MGPSPELTLRRGVPVSAFDTGPTIRWLPASGLTHAASTEPPMGVTRMRRCGHGRRGSTGGPLGPSGARTLARSRLAVRPRSPLSARRSPIRVRRTARRVRDVETPTSGRAARLHRVSNPGLPAPGRHSSRRGRGGPRGPAVPAGSAPRAPRPFPGGDAPLVARTDSRRHPRGTTRPGPGGSGWPHRRLGRGERAAPPAGARRGTLGRRAVPSRDL